MPVCARAALLTPYDAFLTALVKATLPPHVVAALDEPLQASPSVRSTVSLEGFTLGFACGGGGGVAPQPPGVCPLHAIWRAYERLLLPRFS